MGYGGAGMGWDTVWDTVGCWGGGGGGEGRVEQVVLGHDACDCDGMGWNGVVDWAGLGWGVVGWDGVWWDWIGLDGVGWDAMRCHGIGWV